jgi:hypothetical protein
LQTQLRWVVIQGDIVMPPMNQVSTTEQMNITHHAPHSNFLVFISIN